MMDDEDNSSSGSRWSRVRDRILGAYSDHVRAQMPPEQSDTEEVAYANVVYDGNTTYQPGQVIMTDNLNTFPPPQWTISYPNVIGNEQLPYTARCNYCGMETVDYRELRIGRMTKVVVCDICMLKTINHILGDPHGRPDEETPDDDRGSDGDE